VLQCVAVRCAVCCSDEIVTFEEKDVTILSCYSKGMSCLLQCVVLCCSMCCSVLQCVDECCAVCCSVRKWSLLRERMSRYWHMSLKRDGMSVAMCGIVLQYVLQCIAVCCSV